VSAGFGIVAILALAAQGSMARVAVPADALAAAQAERAEEAFAIAAPLAEQCRKSGPALRCLDLLLFAAEQTPMMEAKRGEGFARAALALAERLPGDSPDLLRALEARARSLDEKGPDYSDAECGGPCPKRWKEAEPFYRRALEWRLAHRPGDHAALGRLYESLSTNLYRQKRSEEGRAFEIKGVEVLEAGLPATAGPFARAYYNLVYILDERQRYTESELWRLRRLALAERMGDTDTIPVALAALADNLMLQGRAGDAEPLYRRALELGNRWDGYRGLARALESQQRFAEAEPFLRSAVEIEAANPGRDQQYETLVLLAANLEAQGRLTEAEAVHRLRLDRVYPRGRVHVGFQLGLLAANLDAQGRLAEAEKLHRQALAMVRASGDMLLEIPAAEVQRRLAANLDRQGRHREAEPIYREGIAFWIKAMPGHAILAPYHAGLAATLEAQGRMDDAEAERSRAAAIWRNAFAASHPERIAATLALAQFQARRGNRWAAARASYGEAAAGTRERAAAFRDFGPAAQAELRRYRPIFAGQVAANWALAASQLRAAR
jgi:tetratricopeptide (TPR) repeat protein